MSADFSCLFTFFKKKLMVSDFVITGIISLRIAEYGEFSNLWNSHPKFLGVWPHGLKFKKIENSPESAIDNEIFPVQAKFERKKGGFFFLASGVIGESWPYTSKY